MIDFGQLRGLMHDAFDTDNIVFIKNDLGTVVAENIPCHFVITTADNPGAAETSAERPVPVTVYGEIFTSEVPEIRDGYTVQVEKKDAAGEVVATYEGTAAMPAYRAGRVSIVVKLDDIASAEEPEPSNPTGKLNVPNGFGGYENTADSFEYKLGTMSNGLGGFDNVVYFIDAAFVWSGSTLKVTDGSLGTVTVAAYTTVIDDKTGDRYRITSAPKKDTDGVPYAPY